MALRVMFGRQPEKTNTGQHEEPIMRQGHRLLIFEKTQNVINIRTE